MFLPDVVGCVERLTENEGVGSVFEVGAQIVGVD